MNHPQWTLAQEVTLWRWTKLQARPLTCALRMFDCHTNVCSEVFEEMICRTDKHKSRLANFRGMSSRAATIQVVSHLTFRATTACLLFHKDFIISRARSLYLRLQEYIDKLNITKISRFRPQLGSRLKPRNVFECAISIMGLGFLAFSPFLSKI